MTMSHKVNNEELSRLSKQSKIVAICILIGFTAFCIVIGNNAYKLYSLEKSIAGTSDTIKRLVESTTDLETQIYQLECTPSDKIILRASASPLPARANDGKLLFDYTVWIDLSCYNGKALTSVSYASTNNVSGFESRSTQEAKNGFSMTYRGTLCEPELLVNVDFVDATSENLVFKMCDAI